MATEAARLTEPTGLRGMVYSGRGITLGMTPSGTPFAGYTLSGRSPSSKARRLELRTDEGRVVIETKPTDEAVLKKGNPALLLYPVVIANAQKLAISNGMQTELVMKESLPAALEVPVYINEIDVTSYEPDVPNYTPRITGELKPDQQDWVSVFHIARKVDGSSDPLRETHRYKLMPGVARTMTTYAGGNETPLLPFTRAPMEMAVASNDPMELCNGLFSVLKGSGPDDYRVSAAVLTYAPSPEGGVVADVSIINASDGTDKPQSTRFHLR